MRMAGVNIFVPDELLQRARQANLNVSLVAFSRIGQRLDRRSKIAELDWYLASLDDELGPLARRSLVQREPRWMKSFRRRATTQKERVTLVLDSGGVTALANERTGLLELRRREAWLRGCRQPF